MTQKHPNHDISLVSSCKKLEDAFHWAKQKALSYVQTGKSGPVDQHERSEGTGHHDYIPCYWAGYPFRTAFYIRDYCHQAFGAHILGLQIENLSMLRAFARTANASRKWYPLWALNFDGSPFKLDYHNDDDFVREVPAVFELVEQCYRQWLWTGNEEYLKDPNLWTFCCKAITDFVNLHDTRIPNGVAEGDGSGDIFKGSASYNENRSPLVEAGDGIACQYQARVCFAKLMALHNNQPLAALGEVCADMFRHKFMRQWGVKKGVAEFVRGYDIEGRAYTDFGLESSWFIPMKGICDSFAKNSAYLKFIAQAVESPEGRPSNLEAISYLPGVFFPYNMVKEGWRWLEYIIDQPDKEYPEISFTMVGDIVQHMMGFDPDIPSGRFATVPRLPRDVKTLGASSVPLGAHTVDIMHVGVSSTTVTHTSGPVALTWEAQFYGKHPMILVNGQETPSQNKKLNGVTVSYVDVILPVGESATASTR